MILVFDKNEVLQAVLSNDGSACPFYNPYHDEKINLENTFTFEMPSDHADSQLVVEGSLIAFQDLDSNWQLFEVKRTVDIDQVAATKTVYCDHAFYELLGDIVPSGGAVSASAFIAVTSALSQSRWEVGTVANLGLGTTAFSYQTALACLQQIATTWKGELQFRIVLSGTSITHRYVDFVAQRGTNTGKQFVFGKDLEKVEREVDFTGLYTAMYGRGKATTTGSRLNFASINAGKEYVADATALASYGVKGRHRFGIFDDSQEADPAVLLTKTTAALQLAKVPIVNYQFQVVSLEQISPDYSHEAVRIGDTAVAIDDNFVPPLQLSVRVIEIKRNLLEFEKTQITLGNFKPDTGNSQAFQSQINSKVSNNAGIWDNGAALVPSVLGPAIFDLTSQLRAAGGYVFFTPTDGIMIYDTPDPVTATKVMKLGAGIFGIANSKLSGNWVWKTFGDGGGFTAELITAGKLLADKVQIGPTTTFATNYDPSVALSTANTANTAAATAQTTANSKQANITKAATAPTTPATDDMWIDTSFTPNRLKRWNGTAWVNATPVQASDISAETPAGAQAKADAVTASITNGTVNFLVSATNKISVNSNFYWDSSGFYAISGTNVVRITSGGIGIGTAGTGGAFSTAITGAGIVAEKILAGTISVALNLTAATITAGTIIGSTISGGTISGVTLSALNTLNIGTATSLQNPKIIMKNTGELGDTRIYTVDSNAGIAGSESDMLMVSINSTAGSRGSAYIAGYPYAKADLTVNGIITADSFSGTISGGNVSGAVANATNATYASYAQNFQNSVSGLNNGCIMDTTGGTARLKNSSGYYLAVEGNALRLYNSGGGSVLVASI